MRSMENKIGYQVTLNPETGFVGRIYDNDEISVYTNPEVFSNDLRDLYERTVDATMPMKQPVEDPVMDGPCDCCECCCDGYEIDRQYEKPVTALDMHQEELFYIYRNINDYMQRLRFLSGEQDLKKLISNMVERIIDKNKYLVQS